MVTKYGGPELKVKDKAFSRRKYRYKTRPYRHQVAALKKLLESGWGGALLMDPRTGKTKVSIDYASIQHILGRVNRVVITCPNGVIGVWEEEIEAHCPVPYRITIWDRKGRKRTPLPRRGQDILDFVIVNHDAFSTPGVTRNGRRTRRGGRYFVRKMLKRWDPQLFIVDESHRFKKPSAKKTTMLHSFSYVPHRIILTGTAVTKAKRVADLYPQWMFLNPESPIVRGMTYAQFKERYQRWIRLTGGYDKWLSNRAGPMKKLHKRLHEESFAVARDECFDLPPSRTQIVPVELTGHTAEVYDEMAEKMVAQIKSGEITEAQLRIVQNLRLSQITSGITKTAPTDKHPEGRLVRLGRDKLLALEDLLVDFFEADEKVVIAARWRADIAAIAKVCDRLKTKRFVVMGGVDRSVRDQHRRTFNQMSGPGCFIMQPSASALGIDLRTAAIFVWFSLTNSYVDYTQAMDRVALSQRGVVYQYLLAKGTYDEVMYQSLQDDGDVVKSIMASPERLLRNFKG